jgi:hypothetical protein
MKTEKYKSLLVMVTGFLVLYFVFRNKPAGAYFLYTAIIVGLLGSFIPIAGDWIVKGWYKLAEGLGWINSRILLGAVFFLLLTPIALVYRIFAKNPLKLKKGSDASLFDERNHKFTAEDLENPW